MSVRKIKEKKYTAQLQCITWHAASLSVYEGRNEKPIAYSDMDGDHCYFYTLLEFLQAGWDILKMEDQLSVVLTGDVYPIEEHNIENGVRGALSLYITHHKLVDVHNVYMSDNKKINKVIEQVLENLKQRPIEDFVV